MKWKWIQKISNELLNPENANEPTETFMILFKALMIIYLQNKDGNGYFNSSETTIGNDLLDHINKNHNLRYILFDTLSPVTYEDLAGCLQADSEKSSTKLAMEIITASKNDKQTELTIQEKFKKIEIGIGVVQLRNMIENETRNKIEMDRLKNQNAELKKKLAKQESSLVNELEQSIIISQDELENISVLIDDNTTIKSSIEEIRLAINNIESMLLKETQLEQLNEMRTALQEISLEIEGGYNPFVSIDSKGITNKINNIKSNLDKLRKTVSEHINDSSSRLEEHGQHRLFQSQQIDSKAALTEEKKQIKKDKKKKI